MKDSLLTKQSGSEFLKNALYRYGIEVIENRALPRIEDGLKPVQRFILWSSKDMKTTSFVKSAKITGHTIATYSPHGDLAAYESLVNMVNMRYAPMEGQGNFGGPSTSAASSRYTEARLSQLIRKISMDSSDIDVVPYEPNYDESKLQPVYLPTSIPFLLLNGSEGIAVALTSKIPGFNLEEVCKACISYLETGDISQAVKKIKAPDTADCVLVSEKKEVRSVMDAGDGTLEYECRHTIQPHGSQKRLIILGYVPDFNIESFLNKCSQLQETDLIDVVRNETSESNGDRIVVDFSDMEVYEKKIRPMLRKKVNYKFNVLFSRNGTLKPENAPVGKIVSEWTAVRRITVKQALEKELSETERRISVESAKKKALSNLKIIFKALQDAPDFKEAIKRDLGLSDEEAQMIADMRVEALKRASVAEVDLKINSLTSEKESINSKLSDIDSVIIGQIKDLLSWVRKTNPGLIERKTQISW